MMKTAALICCSDGLEPKEWLNLEQLENVLKTCGIDTVESPYLYAGDTAWSGTAQEKAAVFNHYMLNPTVDVLYDVSGGDLANSILEYLDYSAISKPVWGYSDLTAVLNAIYAKTGQECVLYQVRNLLGKRIRNFRDGTLFDIPVEFLQGDHMEGVVVGGNVRCLLKLAGTPYFPDLTNKILVLEAMSGSSTRIASYFSQLKQMGAFEKVSGILLGTFTKLERKEGKPTAEDLLLELTDKPVAKTKYIGHGEDAKAIVIGRNYRF